MKARIFRTVVAMCLLPAAMSAQDGLRSASLSEPPLTSSLSPPRTDRFTAAPDIQASRKHRHEVRVPFSDPLPPWYFGQALPYAYPLQMSPPVQVREPQTDQTTARARDAFPGASAAPPDRLPSQTPGVRKTFYVIPGCYAGDRPPRPERLPPMCDASKVRVVQP